MAARSGRRGTTSRRGQGSEAADGKAARDKQRGERTVCERRQTGDLRVDVEGHGSRALVLAKGVSWLRARTGCRSPGPAAFGSAARQQGIALSNCIAHHCNLLSCIGSLASHATLESGSLPTPPYSTDRLIRSRPFRLWLIASCCL